MATTEVVILVCDLCGRDALKTEVETHTLKVDGVEVEAEICKGEWAKVERATAAVLEAGRKAKRQRSRSKGSA